MALLFTGGLIIVVTAAFLPTIDVASSASMMFLFLFFLVNICVIRIRRNMREEMNYGFLIPLFPLPPLCGILIQAVLAAWLIHMSYIAWIVGPVWIICGIVIYYFYSRHKAITTEDEIVVLQEEPIPEKKDYRILISVANPANAVSLAMSCYKFCKAKEARTEIEVINMVPVPHQVPLSDAKKYSQAGEEAIGEAMLYLASRCISAAPCATAGTLPGVSFRLRLKERPICLSWGGTGSGEGIFPGEQCRSCPGARHMRCGGFQGLQ